MDLESESSALEPVEDNGLIALETMSIELEKPSNSPPLAKGLGLRKWRRIKRDLVKDTSLIMEDSKILKRVLSGAADPHAKQMHFPGPEVKQDSIGLVGSVNNMAGLAFSAGLDSDNSEDRSSKSRVRYERRMGHSWDKEKTKYLGGKSVASSGDSGQQRKSSVEKSKKLIGDRIKIEKENSHSSKESADSRSSNFVFMQAASYSLSGREEGGRRMMMMDYIEEYSDHDPHNSNRKDNIGEEEAEDYSQGDSVEDSQIKNSGSSNELDPLTEAFNSFHNLQEALKKELQKFQDLGNEPISVLHDGAESSSCIHAGHERGNEASLFRSENMGNLGFTSQDSEILNLVNNVEHLEIKLEETKCILEVKESQIRELESNINVSEPCNWGTDIRIEDIFEEKIEAEIEYLIFSRSVENLKRQIKVIEEKKTMTESEGHKMLSKLGEAETKAENLKHEAQDLQNHCVEITEIQEVKSFKKRVFKTTSCLLLQLCFLFILFNFQAKPESEIDVPT